MIIFNMAPTGNQVPVTKVTKSSTRQAAHHIQVWGSGRVFEQLLAPETPKP